MTGTIFTVAQLGALSTMLVLLLQKRRRDASSRDGDVGHDGAAGPEYGPADGRPLAL
ncbi:MAG: hypothetical protein AAGD33_01295 [Actinomycetota bacterium]